MSARKAGSRSTRARRLGLSESGGLVFDARPARGVQLGDDLVNRAVEFLLRDDLMPRGAGVDFGERLARLLALPSPVLAPGQPPLAVAAPGPARA
jgi:hypothetical protein